MCRVRNQCKYYEGDFVGDVLGCSITMKRAGTQVKLLRRNIDGDYIENAPAANHGILCWHDDYSLLYTSLHSFSYWAD